MNSHISIKGMAAYGGSYYNSFVALYSLMAYQTELLSRLFPLSEVDNMKGYQSKILRKCAHSFHTLYSVIVDEHDYYAAGTIIRMLTDNLASYNLIYHEKDVTLKHLRHYLFILDGLAQRKKLLGNHEMKYDGNISKVEYDALENQVRAAKENALGAMEFCKKAIRHLPIWESQKDAVEVLIDKQNWQFIDVAKSKGHYKWEQLYGMLSDKKAFTDMTVYLSQFVHGLSLSNLTMDNTPAEFEPLVGFGISLIGYALKFIGNDFGLSRYDLYKDFTSSPYFNIYYAASSEEEKKKFYERIANGIKQERVK